jgi:hypothetical protein
MGVYLWTLSGLLRSTGFNGYASEIETVTGAELYETLESISTWLDDDCPEGVDLADILIAMINGTD